MKRNEQAVGGQLWMQGDRMTSATNVPLEGMANYGASAVLSAVGEAVEWRHATEFVSADILDSPTLVEPCADIHSGTSLPTSAWAPELFGPPSRTYV
jgi:hypothetical protein